MQSSLYRFIVTLTVVSATAVLPLAIAPAASSAPSGAAVGAATPMEPRRATVVHRVSPLNRSSVLKDRYRVTLVRRGSCWTSSFVHPELYRCFRGNFIQDPCWRERGRSQPTVVCLLRPWSHEVTRLRLTRRLPDTASGRGRVWGMTMPGGVNCLFVQGASGFVHGHHISYFCRKRWVLLDAPNRGRVWHIRTARRVHGEYGLRGRRPLSHAWIPRAP